MNLSTAIEAFFCNFSIILFLGLSSFWCPKKCEHIAGDKERAQIADIAIDTAMQTANCLYITPVIPPIKAIGTKTAIKTIAIATKEDPTSCMVICVAITADFPSSICLLTFSITTMASSTTTATARTSANNVSILILIPSALSAINVPTSETGIVTQGTRVATASPRNKNMIKITINAVNNIVNSTSLIDSWIYSASSLRGIIFKPLSSFALISSTFLLTALDNSITFASVN